MVCQCFPKLAVDEGHNTAWVLWCSTVVLAIFTSEFIVCSETDMITHLA
jgi:hypothetical protein